MPEVREKNQSPILTVKTATEDAAEDYSRATAFARVISI
jgi:hypothetical protein